MIPAKVRVRSANVKYIYADEAYLLRIIVRRRIVLAVCNTKRHVCGKRCEACEGFFQEACISFELCKDIDSSAWNMQATTLCKGATRLVITPEGTKVAPNQHWINSDELPYEIARDCLHRVSRASRLHQRCIFTMFSLDSAGARRKRELQRSYVGRHSILPQNNLTSNWNNNRGWGPTSKEQFLLTKLIIRINEMRKCTEKRKTLKFMHSQRRVCLLNWQDFPWKKGTT